MSFNSKVKSAIWNEEDGQWHFVIEKNGQIIHDTAHIFFNGSGFTTDWNWPDIPGIDRYKGKLIHAAQWDTSYDYTGKNVALLGNGSTGIQILPAIQPDVKHLTTFIRSPTWITPGFAAEHTPTGDGANFKYSEEQRALWRKDPEAYFKYRKQMEEEFNLAYNFTNANSELQKQRHELVKQMMEEGLKDMDPELRKKLIPDWAVGCRRITYVQLLTRIHPRAHSSFSKTNKGCFFSLILQTRRRIPSRPPKIQRQHRNERNHRTDRNGSQSHQWQRI